MFYSKDEVIKMWIGEFSSRTGLTIDTIRYYNKIGLLVPKNTNKRSIYTEEDIEKADVIKKLKNLNFKLQEIKTLFDLEKDVSDNEQLNDESRDRVTSCLNLIKEKYNEIMKKQQDIIQIKIALEKMINKTNKLLELGYFYNEGKKI